MKTVDSKKTSGTVMRAESPFFAKENGQGFFDAGADRKSFFPSSGGRASPVQAKLNIGRPDDAYEKEADTVADKVVQTPSLSNGDQPAKSPAAPQVQQKCSNCEEEQKLQKLEEKIEPGSEVKKLQRKPIFESNAETPDEKTPVQRKCAECEKDEPLQKKESDGPESSGTDIESRIDSSKGHGESLPKDTRRQMESSIGADFSDVKIHHNANAAGLSRDLHAQAFTQGNDIYFNSGKYDTRSNEGRHLLAHELTHTVQQSGGKGGSVQQRIQKKDENPTLKSTDAAELEKAGKNCDAGFITIKNRKPLFHIRELKSGKYELPAEAVAYFNKNKSKLPAEGTRDTHQDTEWKKAVRTGSRDKLMQLGEFTKDEKPESGQLLRLRPKNDKAKKKGIVGTFTQIVNESLVPNWDFNGTPTVYQIEHSVDWQILGNIADNVDNFILLENKENLRVAKIVEDAITKALEAIAKFYAKDYKNVPMSAKEIKSDKNGAVIDKLDGSGKKLQDKNFYSPKAFTAKTDPKNPFTDDLIVLKEEVIPEGYFLLSSSDRRASYLIPKDADGKVVGAFKITVQKKGDKVTSVEFENRFNGKSTEVGVDKNLKKKKVNINGESKDKYVVQDGEEKSTIGPMLKSLALTRFSPIEIDDKAIVVEGFDVSASGKVKSTLSFLEGVEISFSFENGDFNIKAVIPLDAMTKNIPKPFKVDYCDIEIGGGTSTPIYIGGGCGFSIERLGTGDIFAKLDSTGLSVDGSFNFESKYFDPAMVTVSYAKGEWSVTGTIGIKKGIVKGVKSATLKVSYDKGTITIGGDGELDLPGIDKIKLLAVFAPNGDFTFTAAVELKKLPGIKSGSATVTITSKGEEGLKIGITGEAEPDLPKVPGLEGLKLTISYQDGIFEIRTKVIYKKGKFDGTIEVGVTNKQVDEKGKPQGEASEKGDVVVFGFGELGVDIYNGIHGTVTVRLTPDKNVLIGGKIEKKELKPFGDGFNYDKEIIPFPELEIPLVGIPGMSVSAFIKGGVHFKFSWDPLVLKDLSVEFKETDINQLETASIEIIGSVGSSAHAEVYLAINAGLKARVLVATLTGTLGGEAGLGLDAEAGGKVDATWDLQKGLLLKEIRAFLNVVPKAVFRLTGDVSVDLDLWIAKVNLYYHKWILAEKQLDLSGITLKLDFPIKFDEQGHVILPEYEKMNVEKPNFSGDSGKKILDDAVNGDAKKEEEAKKEQIRQQIKADMHSADNKDVSPSEYTEKMMDKYEKSPDLQVFVKATIEDEAKKMEYEHFEEQKQIVRSAKVPLQSKFTLLNMFTMFHAYVAAADVEAFKGELTRQDEEQKRQQALAANAGVPPDGNAGSGSDPSAKPPVQKKAAFESENEETVSGKAEDEAGVAEPEDEFTEKLDVARSNGSMLPGHLRESMESRMGADFGNVRIHDDAESNALSKQIHAQAFTTGNDIFFSAGRYDPASKQGQHLLAHELTHVLQQEGGGIRTKIQRHPVAPTKVERKAQADIFGVGALPGMDLDGFTEYTGAQADWFVEPTLAAADRNDLWKLLFKTRPGSPILSGVGDIPVKDLRAVTDPQWTDLEFFCWGCSSQGHTVKLQRTGTLAERIALGGTLRVLQGGIPGIVLEVTMSELQLKKIQTDALLLSLMTYLLTFHPHLQETLESAAGIKAGVHSETEKLIDFIKAPGMLAFMPLFGKVRNLHRFAPDALSQVQNNFNDHSRSKPVYLLLYSGHDYNSAFVDNQVLFETMLKDKSKLILMLEGQDSLQDIINKVPQIAADYGQPDAKGVPSLAQVMIAGHGSSRSVEMAGTGNPTINKEGQVLYPTDDLDLDNNKVKTEALLKVLIANMNPATARIVFAGCLVGSTKVPVKDAAGNALSAADIKTQVKDPGNRSLAATTRDLAIAGGKPGMPVEGSRASVGIGGSSSLMDFFGNFHVQYDLDPTAYGNYNVYVATGKEPEGLMRAAVELAADDPVVAANQLRTRIGLPAAGGWYDGSTRVFVQEAIKGVAPGAGVDIVKVNQLANMAEAYFLSFWSSTAVDRFVSEANINPPLAASLYNAILAVPEMNAPAKQEAKQGRLMLELGWSLMDPARAPHVIAYLDGAAALTTKVLARILDTATLNAGGASANLFPAGAAATDGRIRLALAWMSQDNLNPDVRTFLTSLVDETGPKPKLMPAAIAKLANPADEDSILNALGKGAVVVPGIGGAADKPAANADAFPGKAPAMNDVRVESNPYEATVIPPAFVLNVRKQPTMKGEPFHWLKRGETVKVMGFVHQWAAVDINGKLGFAHGNFLSPPPR